MRHLMVLCLVGIWISSASSNAALVNIGDTETYELDANLNLRGWSGGVPIYIPFTAGEYELQFLDTNPNRTAWQYFPGEYYRVGSVRIDEQDNIENMLFDGREMYGVGNTPESAYADAAARFALTHYFTVQQDVIGLAYLTDIDNNNDGGLTIQITKVIPEPSSVSLIALVGASGYAIRRRFLI